MNIRFSIIVPVYNAEAFIRNCINSVLNQTYSDFELILIDDGSQDSSFLICKEYYEKDRRIQLYRKENSGPFETREYGISKAQGEYCLFLDSDDTYEKNTLERVDAEIKTTDADCVIFGLKKVRNGKVISFGPTVGNLVITDRRELFNIVFYKTGFNSMCRKAIKRELLKEENYSPFIHIANGEDLLESLRVYANAKRIAFISDPLYIYNQVDSSNTHEFKIKNVFDSFEVDNTVFGFLKNSNVFDEKDYCKYKMGRMLALCTHIRSAVYSINNIIELERILNQIKEVRHCSELLDEYKFTKLKAKDSLVLLLFKYGKYRVLQRYVKCESYIKKVFREKLPFINNR